ncbi:hypothetical protein C8R46DRAFT_1157393 [Mycena filopes]|nr:hypothetical protein C8R46DRAFT_1157393 [Mycena filopes]
MLTVEQKEQFHRDGCASPPSPRHNLINSNCGGISFYEAFVPPDEVEALLARSKQLLQEFSLEDHPLTKFSTGDDAGDGHIGDAYFLESGDKIRYFLEEDAVVDGKLNRPKDRAVNKIGHALHELDPAFRKVTLENERMRTLVRDLQFHRDPIALQSMVITKQPQIVGEHNDSALGFWIALEQCTAENGASLRFVRLPGGGTGFEPLVPAEVADRVAAESKAASGTYILETLRTGYPTSSLRSKARNTSDKTRFAYTFHMIEGEAAYDEKNWLQPTPAMPFSRILA